MKRRVVSCSQVVNPSRRAERRRGGGGRGGGGGGGWRVGRRGREAAARRERRWLGWRWLGRWRHSVGERTRPSPARDEDLTAHHQGATRGKGRGQARRVYRWESRTKTPIARRERCGDLTAQCPGQHEARAGGQAGVSMGSHRPDQVASAYPVNLILSRITRATRGKRAGRGGCVEWSAGPIAATKTSPHPPDPESQEGRTRARPHRTRTQAEPAAEKRPAQRRRDGETERRRTETPKTEGHSPDRRAIPV
jgi:hypothetical protein